MTRPLSASAAALAGAALLAGCAGLGGSDARTATIQRTTHGIAHISAPDLETLAYGVAYAHAQDNVCQTAQQLVTVRGDHQLNLQKLQDATGAIDIRPAEDDRPFFFRFSYWWHLYSREPAVLASVPIMDYGLLLLFATTGLAAAACVYLPLRRLAGRGLRARCATTRLTTACGARGHRSADHHLLHLGQHRHAERSDVRRGQYRFSVAGSG